MMSFPLFASLIVGSVAAGYAGAWIIMLRRLSDAFGGAHFQTALNVPDGIIIGVSRSGNGKIIYNGDIYNFNVSDTCARACAVTGLWRLFSALFGPGFSRYELLFSSKAGNIPEEIARLKVAFCVPATKKNFLGYFAPDLLEDDSRPKGRREHSREAAALVRIARRRGHRKTKGKVKGFERTVEELACLFDPAAAGFLWMTGKKREISAVRKIYVRAIGTLYQGYGAETIDTYRGRILKRSGSPENPDPAAGRGRPGTHFDGVRHSAARAP